MRIAYILGLLAVGAFGFTSGRPSSEEEEDNETVPYHEEVVTKLEAYRNIMNIQKEVEDIAKTTCNGLDSVLRQLENNKKNLKTILLQQGQKIQMSMAAKEAEEMKKFQEEEIDAEKIEICFNNQDKFKKEVTYIIDKSLKCVNDAAQSAKKSVRDAKNAYYKQSTLISKSGRIIVKKSQACVQSVKDSECTQKNLDAMKEKISETVKEANNQFQTVKDILKKQYTQMELCRKNVDENLVVFNEKRTEIINTCITSPEKVKKSRRRKTRN